MRSKRKMIAPPSSLLLLVIVFSVDAAKRSARWPSCRNPLARWPPQRSRCAPRSPRSRRRG